MNARFSVMDMFNALYVRLFYRSIHVVKSTSISDVLPFSFGT